MGVQMRYQRQILYIMCKLIFKYDGYGRDKSPEIQYMSEYVSGAYTQ